jgi:membrane fusion protein, copper/silver efflux system
MKKLNQFKIDSNKYLKYSLLLILGIFLGWLLFHPSRNIEEKHDHSTEVSQGTIWTCAMHPQIRLDEPGKCPICGMDLIPLVQNSTASIDPDAIHLTAEAAQLANVLTTVVSKEKPVKEIRLYGKVQADERLLQSQVSHVPGRIERLAVNFTGESVVKGQVLAQIYSPELVTAQQELLEAARTKETQPAIYEAAREKLHQWKLTDKQIDDIETSGSVQTTVDITSNSGGIVTSRRVNTGDYVSQGTVLFDIADLSRVWVMFDAYESDLQFLRKGEKISFTLQSLPGENFSANIVFVDPVIDPVTRVAKVRVEIGNQSGRFKPEMFATGIVSSNLVKYRDNLVIPKSAVLWTGKRSIVYVKQPDTDEPVFKIREVGLGPMLGESYVVTDGLSEGEEIVTSGAFSVDAAAQLEGKPSMMNPQGGATSSMPGMVMPGDTHAGNAQNMPGMEMPGGDAKPDGTQKNTISVKEIVGSYLRLKNALVADNSAEAADAGKAVEEAFKNFNTNTLTADQKKVFTDVENDAVEHAEHIGENKGNIEHQREHFEMLSNDIYDLVKTFESGQVLYRDFCPMYNKNRGAYWLSETREIQNPYFGKEMLTCGVIKEELK